MKRILPTLLLVSLLGCASHPPQTAQVESVDEAVLSIASQICCSEFSELQRLPLANVGEAVDFQMGPPDKPLSTANGRAYARILALPSDGQTYHIEVESFTSKTAQTNQVFGPVILVLNDDYSVSRSSRLDMLLVENESALWKARERLTIFVRVDRNKHPREKFIVITTAPESYGKYLKLRNIYTPESRIHFVSEVVSEQHKERDFPAPIQLAPEGTLRITNVSSTMKKPFDLWIRF